jgi:hypothetical protein
MFALEPTTTSQGTMTTVVEIGGGGVQGAQVQEANKYTVVMFNSAYSLTPGTFMVYTAPKNATANTHYVAGLKASTSYTVAVRNVGSAHEVSLTEAAGGVSTSAAGVMTFDPVTYVTTRTKRGKTFKQEIG